MLEFLTEGGSRRKLQLFGIGCCRRIWHRIFDARCRQAVEAVERFIEGQCTISELDAERILAEGASPFVVGGKDPSGNTAAIAIAWAPHWNSDHHWPCIYSVCNYASHAACRFSELQGKNKKQRKQNGLIGCRQEHAAHAALIRDIFGNPFSPSSVRSHWLTWNDNTIVKLAQAIYDARAFDRLPLLADALEEAGCDNQEILDHCRSAGEHVRGCWVVDLILGKS
jgi:hypothetical protein